MRRRLGFSIPDLWRELYFLNLFLGTIVAAIGGIDATHKSVRIIFHESADIASLSVHKFLPVHCGNQDHVSSPSSFLHTTSFSFTKVCMHPLVSFANFLLKVLKFPPYKNPHMAL
ncbi:hypothetical protein [Pontibacillus sp. HMF3514]|uniref:hypothetical protein n=1 Tax=Pontibacillus sp. HMF3514 TaxID=2692425 RepID=UPI00131FDF41|nr:hypothetical protein [Pontibacillus sp. HMF3514]QHE53959.1 hypothetical protein GS400_18880 [Pontibacillus sp. HMF3514]